MSILSKLAKELIERAAGEGAAQRAVARRAAPKPPLAVKPEAPAVVRRVSGANRRAAPASGIDREALRSRYPVTLPPRAARDPKTGKAFMEKVNSPEALAVQKELKRAQADIDAGGYTPIFDPAGRFNVDASRYQLTGNTLEDAAPRTRASIEKYAPIANDPEALDRLSRAYEVGAEHPGARDWYAMGQLEDAYQQELGSDLGGLAFKYNFANPMAATTGGADPRSNLRMALYGNHLRERGLPIPEEGHQFPFPVGGRFASGNMSMYGKAADRGDFMARNNPKRFNFAGNFMGHSDKATIDEQMSGLWDPSYKAPPGPSYGAFEAALGDVARKYGVDPMNLQDVAWAGAKLLSGRSKGYVPSPMIDQINHMVERTARLTGVDPDEAFDDIFIKHGPGYAEGGLV